MLADKTGARPNCSNMKKSRHAKKHGSERDRFTSWVGLDLHRRASAWYQRGRYPGGDLPKSAHHQYCGYVRPAARLNPKEINVTVTAMENAGERMNHLERNKLAEYL